MIIYTKHRRPFKIQFMVRIPSLSRAKEKPKIRQTVLPLYALAIFPVMLLPHFRNNIRLFTVAQKMTELTGICGGLFQMSLFFLLCLFALSHYSLMSRNDDASCVRLRHCDVTTTSIDMSQLDASCFVLGFPSCVIFYFILLVIVLLSPFL